MERFREYEENLKTRYTHLYGNAGFEIWSKKEHQKMLITAVVSVVIFLCLIASDISASKTAYSNVVVNERGQIVSVIRPDAGEQSFGFSTNVTVLTEKGKIEKEYYVTIEPAGDQTNVEEDPLLGEMEKDTSETQLKRLISGLNEDTDSYEVVLPQCLENGDRVVWEKADNTDFIIYMLGELAVLWLIYHNRFHAISREEKMAKESIIKELPEFINKLVLLINAGVILNSAFLKVAEGCDERKVKESYFYRRIVEIGYKVNEMNASFYKEMYDFARFSGVKELMRITNIMIDNINKGDDLSGKLRRENELLWFARKQQAEEKGRLAETKMTLPLMMLLTVLIMVTIAPALMEM